VTVEEGAGYREIAGGVGRGSVCGTIDRLMCVVYMID
jgi:hypothetical protein